MLPRKQSHLEIVKSSASSGSCPQLPVLLSSGGLTIVLAWDWGLLYEADFCPALVVGQDVGSMQIWSLAPTILPAHGKHLYPFCIHLAGYLLLPGSFLVWLWKLSMPFWPHLSHSGSSWVVSTSLRSFSFQASRHATNTRTLPLGHHLGLT